MKQNQQVLEIVQELIEKNVFNEKKFDQNFNSGISKAEDDFGYQFGKAVSDAIVERFKQNKTEEFLINEVKRVSVSLDKLHDSQYAYALDCLCTGLNNVDGFELSSKIKENIGHALYGDTSNKSSLLANLFDSLKNEHQKSFKLSL